MFQPIVIRRLKASYAVRVAGLVFLIVGSMEGALGQASASSTTSAIKKLVYQVQTFKGSVERIYMVGGMTRAPSDSKGGGDLIYGIPGGTRPLTSDIYEQSDPNGGTKRLLQWGEAPAWSYRGDKIAFLGFTRISTEQQGTAIVTDRWRIEGTSLLARQIYVMNADGSGVRRITSVPNGVWDFAWSPVENKIAYCEQGKDDQTAIVVMNLDAKRRQELTKMGQIRCAVGMPILHKTLDKNKTMTSTKSGAGKVLIKLVGPIESSASDEVVTGELVGVPTLTWSPDGKLIAFTGIMKGKPVIGIVDKDETKPLGVGYSALWSADGKRLLFRHDTGNVTALGVVNADGTEARKILDNESAEFGMSWFPDGKSIVFGSQRETKNRSEIFRVNLDGGGLQKIASLPNESLSNPVVSPDGTKLLVDALQLPIRDADELDFSLVLVDLTTHQQQSLGKGSHASILWQHP
ncbi:MAG TPA: hypothetical protein VGS27_26175 [Candidatus Sulfotelmatobacter sp.]|nr:hypothetical protein [Candidatus Sulfotelmatobacter sp.]